MRKNKIGKNLLHYHYSRMHKIRGFTIIELLVVISIIGLLGSIVLVSTQGARRSAKEKRSLQFSATVQHSLGADAIGIWNFDELVTGLLSAGATVKDSSGNGNDGTVFGSLEVKDDGIIRKAVYLSGNNKFIVVPSSPKLQSQSGKITIEGWLKPNTSNVLTYILLTSSIGLYISQQSQQPTNVVFFNGGCDGQIEVTDFSDNKWNHIVGTYNASGTNGLKIYLNGTLLEASVSGTPSACSAPTNLTGGLVGRYLQGYLDEVRMYDRSLTSYEVQRHYARGLWKRMAKVSSASDL